MDNPLISQQFIEEIKNQTSEIIDIDGVKIKTCKNVFPPRSNFSESSEKLHEVFGGLEGLRVLDLGTGTGIQAIQAIRYGAQSVIAVDINPAAIACAKENAILNNVADKIQVKESDLFSSLSGEKFDLIIANLPVVDFPLKGTAESALYDPEYKLHKRFFKEAGNYLNLRGIIIMTHINFKGEGDFEEFEAMLQEFGYTPERYIEINSLGYLWRMYRIKLNN
jgi:release factor glutamine methyltransferase